MIQGYKALKVYQRSYKLALKIYEKTKEMPKEEQYGLTSQLKRAATSIPLNIAEGYGKKESTQEFKRYLMIARGSCNEMQVLLDFCRDLGYVSQESYQGIYKEYEEITAMIVVMASKWKSFETKI